MINPTTFNNAKNHFQVPMMLLNIIMNYANRLDISIKSLI